MFELSDSKLIHALSVAVMAGVWAIKKASLGSLFIEKLFPLKLGDEI